jgi:hypothetical protein
MEMDKPLPFFSSEHQEPEEQDAHEGEILVMMRTPEGICQAWVPAPRSRRPRKGLPSFEMEEEIW